MSEVKKAFGNETEIQIELRKAGVNDETKLTINNSFNSFFENVEVWINRAKDISVTDESQTAEMEHARNIRLKLREIRIEADKVRKAMKDESLRYNKAVQGVYNILEYMIKPVEDNLMQQEKFAEIQEQKRKDALAEARYSEVCELIELGYIPDGYSYGEMSEEDYQRLFKMAKKLKTEAEAEEKRIEKERIEKEKADAEEREKQRLENEKLKKEAEEREKQIAKERQEREKIEKELATKKEAEKKAKMEAEAKAKAEQEAKRKAEQSPDRDKLRAFANSILEIEKPKLTDLEMQAVLKDVVSDLKLIHDEILSKIKEKK